jgi:hypothetical protein
MNAFLWVLTVVLGGFSFFVGLVFLITVFLISPIAIYARKLHPLRFLVFKSSQRPVDFR